MEDDRQNGAVCARPPGTSSDTRGTIANHGPAAGDGGSSSSSSVLAAASSSPPPPSRAHQRDRSPRAAAPAVAAVRGAAPPYGGHLNNNNNNPVIKGQQPQPQLKGPGNSDHRNRRPRRGKRKSKRVMPYMKNGLMFRYKALAPNNTNQFLMEDHNDGPDIDKKLSARYNNENGRTRNSSNTSIESDGELIYSSSDDDGTSIQKEFCDTYRLVQEEQLAELTKNELTQRVIELEEKIQVIESKRHRKSMTYLNDTYKGDEDDSIDPEEYRVMQRQIRELTTQNKLLQTEIETLKQVKTRKSNSDSSVDSESSSESSDSSSSSSDEQEIEMKILLRDSDDREQNPPKDD